MTKIAFLETRKQCCFKVARPGFSLTIPTLFEHEMQTDASNETGN